jgi:hypothetical protein
LKETKKATKSKPQKSFIAFDGEGISDYEGAQQRYVLFGNSLHQSIEAHNLTYHEIFDFLLKCKQENPNSYFVMFGMNYDINMFVKDIPVSIVKNLWSEGSCVYRGYRLTYLPSKMFTVSKDKVSIVLYDLFSFFQQSFVEALKGFKIVDDETLATIIAGKEERGSFNDVGMDFVRNYFFTEVKALALLAEELRVSLVKANIYISKWHGPGAIANFLLSKNRVDVHRSSVNDLAPFVYAGGRFEQFKIGYHDGPVFQYDIRSAYPEALAQLPNLDSGWHYVSYPVRGSIVPHGFYHVSDYEFTDYKKPHPFIWRSTQGNIGFPHYQANSSWQSGSVVLAALEAGLKFVVLEGWFPKGKHRPMYSLINTLYDQRAIWKAQGNSAHFAAKLGMNSIYGKFAQQVGGTKEKIPKWHQLDWAAMITGYTRAKLFSAMMLAPDNIIACETDSIFSTVSLPLDIGTKLGQWDLEVHDNILYIQNGIYFTNGEHAKYKIRGLGKGMVDYDHMLNSMNSTFLEPYDVSVRRFRTMGSSLGTDKWCVWEDQIKTVNPMAGDRKRVHVKEHCDACKHGLTFREGLHDMIPNPTFGIAKTTPYKILWNTREDMNILKEMYD